LRDMPTLKIERPELPFLRFLEKPHVYYPGIELVVDAELSTTNDPYLDDHVFRGERLLPAVIGMEAMAQAATALAGTGAPPVLEQVEFARPVTISHDRPAVLRVAALMRTWGTVEVVLRTAETGFEIDHFRATCRLTGPDPGPATLADRHRGRPPVPVDPGRQLYGSLLFQAGRFRRLRGYRRLEATAYVAEIGVDAVSWFAAWLPERLILGDPGSRDACLHAIQSCVPDVTVLPAAVERLVVSGSPDPDRPLLVHGRERSQRDGTYIWDLEVTSGEDRLLERWEGLRLERVRGRNGDWALPAVLAGPLLERRVEPLDPQAGIRVVVEPPVVGGPLRRREASRRALARALGEEPAVRHRPDGKPEVPGRNVSAAHGAGLTLVSSGPRPLACDLEVVVQRPLVVWEGLLGPARLALARRIAVEAGESETVAATRVWSAMECARKFGSSLDQPSTVVTATPDGTVVLGNGTTRTVTVVGRVHEVEARVVFAMLAAAGGRG
jgi:enediyne polyketide synthase